MAAAEGIRGGGIPTLEDGEFVLLPLLEVWLFRALWFSRGLLFVLGRYIPPG